MKFLLCIGIFVTIFIGINGLPADKLKKVQKPPKEEKKESLAEENSDMLMEPNDFLPENISPDGANLFGHTEYNPIVADYVNTDAVDPAVGVPDGQTQAAQSFIPSFFRDVQPLGHSRPYYSQEQQSNHRFNGNRAYDQSILGSGDFGVIRGGTFYQDNDPPTKAIESNDFYSFYNNGHGRPAAALYQQRYNFDGDEQFSNFRDFADINTPSDPAYSQFVVVYANKNSTSVHANPKNIFEQLQLLDEQAVEEKKNGVSKFKQKLANTKLEKKYKKKLGPKDADYEPLLALS